MQDLSRQCFLGRESDQVLARIKAAVVGLCGGGSHIGQQLAHVGVGRVALFDPDIVEASNLNRMVGATASDAEQARAKVEVVAERMRALNPEAKVDTFHGPWQQHALQLRDATVVFGCVDSFGERAQLEAMCRRFLIPYIDVGMDVSAAGSGYVISGQVILSMAGGPCMRCLGFLTEDLLAEEARRYGAAGGKPQVVWPNGVLASTAIAKFMSLILPWQGDAAFPSAMTEYDGNRGRLFESHRVRALEGRACTHFNGPHAIGDPFFEMPSAGATGNG
jgi:hypothetical protein